MWYMSKSVVELAEIQAKMEVITSWLNYQYQDAGHEPCQYTEQEFNAAHEWRLMHLKECGHLSAAQISQTCENRIRDLDLDWTLHVITGGGFTLDPDEDECPF